MALNVRLADRARADKRTIPKDQAIAVMNPRVKEILSVEPFVIKALWTDDKIRIIDFQKFLAEYIGDDDSLFGKILRADVFLLAKTDGRTIYWDNITQMEDYDGSLISAPLDFCPDVLFEQSVPV
jgi:hypothetical protein